MIRIVRLLLCAAVLACAPALANFHLWSMSELYSSADGKVQFLELRGLTGSQQFLTGHSLNAEGSAGSHVYEFNRDLPSPDTGGATFLVATQSFANLGLLTPDYIVPDNFFSSGSGTIVFGEGADVWNYTNLPHDGTSSLNRSGTTGTNSPRNFLGGTATIPASTPQAAVNVHGLWWNDPDQSESGWGVNLIHHGNILFVTWFTYDTNGNVLWLFMSAAHQTATNTYSDDIYQSTGSPFNAYDTTHFVPTKVGTGTFTFSDGNHGTFDYTVNGVHQVKNIKRFIFRTLPTCDQSGAPATNFTDLWWNPAESGWGVNVEQQENVIFATWFTYGADGKVLWLSASDMERTTGNTFTGELDQTSGPAFSAAPWNPALVHATPVGNATFTFTDSGHGTFSYTVGGVTQTKQIERDIYALPATTCR